MNEKIRCNACKKLVGKNYAMTKSLIGNSSIATIHCLDCDEKIEDELFQKSEASYEELLVEYGSLPLSFIKIRQERLERYYAFKKCINDIRKSLPHE